MMRAGLGMITAAVALSLSGVSPAEEINILFLSKSVGFEHSVVAQNADKPSLCDTVLSKLAEQMGAKFATTKDASQINAENLKEYQLVIFYTQGELTQEGGKDGSPAMGANGVADLLAWIENGGGFVGFHCASDTFHTPEGGPVTPFLQMVGGEFAGHGKQFVGTVKVVDADHPTVASIPKEWSINDEWYTFRNLNKDQMHVVALLDPGEERSKQEMYNVPNYPVIWCSERGKGRVFFNAMGHREDVWENETFQKSVVDAIQWSSGKGSTQAKPNYAIAVGEESKPAAKSPGISKKKEE
ncbi:MAG: ThuA domain-containing protein [Candidatus Hydrogenedentes bacterium]|nr:ThuA domain-containing protein [Candidatus Hydrogenedentota bacterium]